MPDETILVGVLAVLSVMLIHFVKNTLAVGNLQPVLRRDNPRFVAILIVLVVNIPYFLGVQDNGYELQREGLSTANIFTIFNAIVMAAAAAYLLAAARRLRFDLISGSSFWLLLLFALYFASAIWSNYPQASAFRALELIGYYVVAVFVFTGRRPLHNLYWIMFFEILVAGTALALDGITGRGGDIKGAIQSNQHSLYAAVFLLLHYHLYRSGISGYLYGLFFLLVFQSAATFAAFLGGAVTYAVYGYASGPVYRLRVPITLSIIGLYSCFILYPEPFSGVIDIIAPAMQANSEKFYNATGRIELWKFYYDYLKDLPLGSGLWSERFLFTRGYDVPWFAWNTHNGFLAAWSGAGAPAVVCLATVYVSTIARLWRQDVSLRRVCFSLLFMLFVNSMTYSGIGGIFTMWYYVLAAIIVLSNLRNSEVKRVIARSPAIGQLGKSALHGET